MRIHDLSVAVLDGADWYREAITPPVRIEDIGGLASEGWLSHVVRLAVLNGTTYLETSGHLIEGGTLLEDVPPERLLRRAHVARVSSEGQELAPPDEPVEGFRSGEDALLLASGWDAQLGSPGYYDRSPYFGAALQSWILDLRPSILGGDMMSFDHPDDNAMPFLRGFFGMDGMILCPLRGLGGLPRPTVTLCAAPLKLAGANCAPCRALAWCDDREPDGEG